MHFVDLTHIFNEKISVYPGGSPPTVRQITNVKENGYASKQIAFTSHQGTHIDGMAHMVADGKTLNQIPLEQFSGTALSIDVKAFAEKVIPKSVFEELEELIVKADFIILNTGWSSKWGSKDYELGFPTPSSEAMSYLCENKLKGIGMDCFSPDPVNSPDYRNHQIAFAKDVLLIENLTNLEELPEDELFFFQCFPMKIEAADGAPIRALANVF